MINQFIPTVFEEYTKSIFQFVIDDKGIVDFNSNLGTEGKWGRFGNPFVATHFMTIISNQDSDMSNNNSNSSGHRIIDFKASSEIAMEVVSNNPDLTLLEVDYIRLGIIGCNNFERINPRTAWGKILDLKETDGAIGADGSYYLGESRGIGEFKIVTCNSLCFNSYNLEYEIGFTILDKGQNRYCVIDPLIRTTSGG